MKTNFNTPAFKGNYAVVINNNVKPSAANKFKYATSNFVDDSRGRVTTSEHYLYGEPRGALHLFSMPKTLDNQFEKLAHETGFKAINLDKTV